MTYKSLSLQLLVVCAIAACCASAQVPMTTSHVDTARTNANPNEVLLTPQNVNSTNFGHFFSVPVDYAVLAQPLYVPQVNVQGQGVHNVVYVVTQANSVYAIDADSGTQLWYASMNNGGSPATVPSTLPCGLGQGFNQEGIIGTPVIDLTTNTMYLVAKSVINGQVTHYIHALDITSGNEQVSMNSPMLITASSVSNKGHVTKFNSLHQKNRPGLLLQNGVLYLGFGSNGCNDSNSGWLLSYSASNLQQQGVFNTSPDIGLTSIWQTGSGIAADIESGNIFVSTGESANYDVPAGGQSYSNSVLKLSPENVPLMDYFTPWMVGYLNKNDLDVSSTSPLILPDQPGPYPHELVAVGKQAVVYLLDRDNLGMYAVNDSQIIQELSLNASSLVMASPAYWNGMVYFNPNNSPIQSYQLVNGALQPFAQTAKDFNGGHAISISANGFTSGVLWVINGNQLMAYDAVSLNLLYSTAQISSRDKLPTVAHFATQTVANGKVYVATQNSLEAYALFNTLTVVSGGQQSGASGTQLPVPIQVLASNPYTGQPVQGVTVTFSDGKQGGTLNPTSALTDSNGMVSTSFTFPAKAATYTITASATGFGNLTITETAVAGAAAKLVSYSGSKQTAAAGSVLPAALIAKVTDSGGNGVAGITVNFTAKSGQLNPASSVTNAQGLASTSMQLPTTPGTISVTASSSGLKSVSYVAYSVAGAPASINPTAGNNQAAPAGTLLPQALSVIVKDQYGNPITGAVVTFSDNGAGGTFGSNPVTTSAGVATDTYTLPPSSGPVTITATVSGVSSPAAFAETAQ